MNITLKKNIKDAFIMFALISLILSLAGCVSIRREDYAVHKIMTSAKLVGVALILTGWLLVMVRFILSKKRPAKS